MAGISIGKLLIIAAVIVLLFGTKKLGSLGADLGSAIKGFKKAMNEDESGQNHSREDADLMTGRIEDKPDYLQAEVAKSEKTKPGDSGQV